MQRAFVLLVACVTLAAAQPFLPGQNVLPLGMLKRECSRYCTAHNTRSVCFECQDTCVVHIRSRCQVPLQETSERQTTAAHTT